MHGIWTAAFSVAGVGAVAFFVFYSLHMKWLSLRIFARLSRNQTFALMLIFLVLTFSSLLAGLAAWHSGGAAQRPGPQLSPSVPDATRDFFIGRWEVQQKFGNVEGGTFYDYFDDGTLSGYTDVFVNGEGRRQKITGHWEFRHLAKDEFVLTLDLDGQGRWQGTFRVLDHDHIHCVDQNYDAVRVTR